MMNNKIILITALIASASLLSAEGISPVGIDSLSFDRHGDFMVVEMDLDLKPVQVRSSRAQIITPMMASLHGDTLQLPSVGVYGHTRYINYLRNDHTPLSNTDEVTFEGSDHPEVYDYMVSVPFQTWMDSSQLLIRRRLYGCTNCLLEERFDPVASYMVVEEPEINITDFSAMEIAPIVESLEGAAFIDFVVDKTDINPAYRRNPRELLKIQESIDTVLNDPDVIITSVWLKGFASPESPYSHNRDLAIGRTAALKEHIRQLYNFNPDIISTDFEAEDWAGLRKYVETSNIDNKEKILEIIDSDMDPDPKEALIKKTFPREYRFMLENFYPALRHTEYRITYQVKRFDDVDKIRQLMRTKPNRLTLREFHILANSCVPGSDEYNEVFETAARMYPNDPDAAINAANAALKRKDYASAEKFLSLAGDSDNAVYARGALAFAQGDYDRAESLLRPISSLPKASNLIRDIEAIRIRATQKYRRIDLK